MSLILKGIDLPKDQTIIIHYVDRDGEIETVFVDENDIIQIPKNHGRLIDGDELKKRLYGYERWTGIDEAPYEYAEKEVYDAPTILEAEE